MGIKLSSSFNVKVALPLDERLIFENLTEANALDVSFRYIGMLCYIKSEKTYYALKNDINTFEEINLNGGMSIKEWISGENYFINDYIYYQNRIFQALVDTSNPNFNYSEWRNLSGSIYCDTIAQRPLTGEIGICYIVGSDSNYSGNATIYIWDTGLNDYKMVAGNSSGGGDTKQSLVSLTDTTEGFLETKIVGTTNKVNITKNNTGANEQLQIGLSNNIFDKTVDTAENITEGITNKFYKADTAKDDIGSILVDTTTIDFNYDNTAKTIKSDVKPNSSIQKIEIGKNGAIKSTRKQINFIEGTNVTLGMTDDTTNDKLDVTVTSLAEVNTASNTGSSGVGIFKQKDVFDLQFKKIDSANNKLLITDDTVNGIVKLQIDDSKLSINGSQIPDLSTAIANDGNMAGLISKSHEHSNMTVLNDIGDINGHISYKGVNLGDVIMASIDSNLDGVVDKASTLDGMTVGVNELNYLQGTKGNIQNQIDALGGAINLKEAHKTSYSDLSATTGMVKGDAYIVDNDESPNGNGNRTWYVYNGSLWIYMGTTSIIARNFTTQPINIVAESTGIIPETRVDALIARKSELPTIANKSVLDSITDVSGILNYKSSPIFDKSMVIDDTSVITTKSWSSSKINSAVGQVGVKSVSELGRDTNKFLVYDGLADKLIYTRMFIPDWQQTTEYQKGNVVWYDGSMYRCSTTHTSQLLLETDIDKWVSINGGGAGGVAQLKEVEGQINIASQDSVYIHLPIGFDKYDIRTVYAKSLQNNNIVVEIYNATNAGFKVYESLELPEIHDTLQSPCSDKDSTKCLHVKLFNKGTIPTDIKYLFYVTSLS